ncbi:3-oxoacyl-(acyl-carrier-protein) synthase [Kitasatospora sp. MAA4]|uniref:beta-ketoacyl synthase chain length factor n=1 Tax=Kitasatospora sp. MAA4 TaxID=3035093 RepID=UPI0024750762|nr:beta-ketoacyl synthase chain length factor [Kitasatospora sp. MAA4]MDH6131411.1 3-oxoacyl-(acyl-carrier-protein) synthase [Kitasatospora sp. MAA4]
MNLVLARELGLSVLACAHWPDGPEDTVTPVPGFILSSFQPLVVEVAQRCLEQRAVADPAVRTGLLLASARGDTVTRAAVAAALAEGRPVAPLLFYQSNPNAVAGHIAARWGLDGPVVCTAPLGAGAEAVLADALGCAALLIEDGDADQVLVIAAEQAEQADQADQADQGDQGDQGDPDHAVALLVAPAAAHRRLVTRERRDQRS